jgi:hypothetical protein
MSCKKYETDNDTTPTPSSLPAQKTSFLQSVFIGSVAGGMEVLCNHPLFILKFRIQLAKASSEIPSKTAFDVVKELARNPRQLIVGIVPNMTSMIPITAIQVSLNNLLKETFFAGNQPLDMKTNIACAFIAGIGSSLVSSPTEMIMGYQTELKQPFFAVTQHIIRERTLRALYAGLSGTACREGLFTVGFLGLMPFFKEQIQPWFMHHEYVPTLLAGSGAGILATLTSHPFDTIKTRQQARRLTQPENMVTAVKNIYSKSGVTGFFAGGVPRGTRVVSAITLIGFVTELLTKWLQQHKTETPENGNSGVRLN